MSQIVIIGAGFAGYTVAREWRKLKLKQNDDLVIITADSGDFYSKPMLSNALQQNKSPERLINMPKAKMEQQLQANILAQTKVMAIKAEQHYVETEQETIAYDKLVLALGASPIRLPIQGNGAEQVVSVNHWQDYQRIYPKLRQANHLAILGAGLIACEFANDFLSQENKQVDIFDIAAYPLSRLLPETVGIWFAEKLAQIGVNWHFETSVSSIDNQHEQWQLNFGEQQSVTADLVLSAIGLRPEISLAQQAGLNVNRGIKVNRYLQTSDPDIYALGDCAEVEGLVLPFILPIRQAGRVIAKNLTGELSLLSYPAMPIVVKTPAMPTVIAVPVNQGGEWQVTLDDHGVKALNYLEQQLQGFVLMGAYMSEKQVLARQLPMLFA